MRREVTVPDPTPEMIEWANERAGMDGEEHEHTLYANEDDIDTSNFVQVWNDHGDDGLPHVGFFGHEYAPSGHMRSGPSEFRSDLSPDQALDLAAMLIVHAQDAREAALERALDDA